MKDRSLRQGTKKKFTVRTSEARSEEGRGARLSAPVDKCSALEAKGMGLESDPDSKQMNKVYGENELYIDW